MGVRVRTLSWSYRRIDRPFDSVSISGGQVFRKIPTVDPVAAGVDWSFMYTRVSRHGKVKRVRVRFK